MKVALICPTIGQTRRGYERYFGNLFRYLRPTVDITLYKGGGPSCPKEMVVPHFTRTGVLHQMFPNRFRHARYRLEFASFAWALFPHLALGDFDLVHFIDPPLARPLHQFRRWTSARFKILFSDGGPAPVDCSAWTDHTHVMNPADEQRALLRGEDPSRITLISPGLDPEPIDAITQNRQELRAQWGIAGSAFLVVSVTTINRGHKRVDHLIREASGVRAELLLWLDGGLFPDGEPDLIEMGRQQLGERFRHTHVASEKVAELYRMADVVVSSATHETFGIALAEAMYAGTPVVAHDSPHFRWLVGKGGFLVDMTTPGALRELLECLARSPETADRVLDLREHRHRFAWPCLKSEYEDMYRRVLLRRF